MLKKDLVGNSFQVGERGKKKKKSPEDCLYDSNRGTTALANSVRRKGGLPFSINNYGRFNHHFCTLSVMEVPEMLENLMTRLCS